MQSILDNTPVNVFTLKGKTLRGKNRVARGGETWDVLVAHPNGRCFVRSQAVGNRECFWMTREDDQHVVVTLDAEYDLHEMCCNIAEDFDGGAIHGWRVEQVKRCLRAGGTTGIDEDGEIFLVWPKDEECDCYASYYDGQLLDVVTCNSCMEKQLP